jgi:hypothetical protein
MMSELPRLREEYRKAFLKLDALTQAQSARKEEAKEIRSELESAALADDMPAIEAAMDGPRALDEAYRTNNAAQTETHAERGRIEEEIFGVYFKAAEGKGEPVDWKARLVFVQGGLYDGWMQHFGDGHWLITETELVLPELSAMDKLIWSDSRNRIQHLQQSTAVQVPDAYRIRAQYPAYRETCWTDYSGQKLLDFIRPFLAKNDLAVNVNEFLADLSVLQD